MAQMRPLTDRGGRSVAWLVLGTFAVYFATGVLVAHVAGLPTLDAATSSARAADPKWLRPIVLLFGVSGLALALVVPAAGWAVALAAGRPRCSSLFHRAVVLNLVQASAFVSLWKASAGTVPPRFIFMAWQGLIAAIGLVVMVRADARHRIPRIDGGRSLQIGAVVLLFLLPTFLWNKTFVEDASGDGTEAFEFSRSLATNQLPHWDLENGFYGFYPEFMLFAYPTQLAFIAIGETEGAQRLPVFFYLLGIYLVLAELVRGRRRQLSRTEILLLTGAAVLFIVFHGYHSTYELVADLAEPTGVDTFFTFLATSALYALITRQRLWWAVFALAGSMALAAGLPFAVLCLLGLAATRRRTLRSLTLDALAFAVPWCGLQFLVKIYSLFHPLGTTKWELGNLLRLYAVQIDFGLAAAVVANLAIVAGVVPLVGLSQAAGRDRIGRMIAVPAIAYCGLLIVFGRANPHYVIPISLFPAALFLRSLATSTVSSRTRRGGHVVYGTFLVVLTVVLLPVDRTPHTVFREFGAQTLMLYDSYPAVVEAATAIIDRRPELYAYLPSGKPAFPWEKTTVQLASDAPLPGADASAVSVDRRLDQRSLRGRNDLPWGLSHHVWIRYSGRIAADGREYLHVLAAAHLAPTELDGFSRQELPGGWVLFYRPGQSIFASLAP